ncbi:carbohydrate kinase [Paraoerskovia sediminicola]|uniref:Carbohydrate kinase n=1 Tax=Paraoerskovia sediminicola TaxID=1138587 RepID=A0ABN6X9G9_9CELL|nr:rhamnulokinase family protein [Paraoerskovia sediminicola]BDZ41367.1 carbohydrate kinase [Paraoerskovia sediminicola]
MTDHDDVPGGQDLPAGARGPARAADETVAADEAVAPVAAVAAVDLGATSGRVMLALLHGDPGRERVELEEVARFANGPVEVPEGDGAALHWDLLHLWRGVLDGLRAAGVAAAARGLDLGAIGIDSWAVDYGLTGADGALLGNPRCYRDPRLEGVAEKVLDTLGAEAHYRVNGLQTQPFNTEFQLVAGAQDAVWPLATSVRLIPDLLASWLTGRVVAEVTNASTTGLVDATTRQWSPTVIDGLVRAYPALGDLRGRLADLVEPGDVVGHLTGRVRSLTGLGAVPVVAVGTHDTASAVVGVPAADDRFAYVSSGTWSLVGVELDAPVLTQASREANVTNELGVDGTVRYLKNVMGLWVLSETLRTWRESGRDVSLAEALAAAETAEPGRTVVDVDGPQFLAPGDMSARLAEAARASGQPVPDGVGQVVRCVLDSLAAAYARAVDQVTELSGRGSDAVTAIHVVGGGSQNALLCRLTAEATGLPVVAGPTEGAALGNAVVAARGVGLLTGTLTDLRGVVRRSSTLVTYEP